LYSLIFGAIAVVVALLLAGWAYQQVATAQDHKRQPAPGKLVDLDGRDLHLLAMGQGSPTVIFESGLMSTVLSWDNIQPEISKSTRTACYDRAGLGWSDPGPAPRDAERIVSELQELLKRASVPPPYILVGHSFGGLTTRLFAARYPDQVSGLILIDPVVPQEWNPANEQNQKRIRTGATILRRATVLSRVGVIRFISLLLRVGAKRIAEPLVRLTSRGAPKGDGTSSSPLFWKLPTRSSSGSSSFFVPFKLISELVSCNLAA